MRSGRGDRRVSGESKLSGGYALVMTVVLMIPLLAITAVGIDVGIWFLQAQRNQRAADAAALAGVVWLPDETKAQAEAYEALRLNGLDPGVDSNISASRLGDSAFKVRVSTKSVLTFSEMLLSEFAITRSAVAEYNPPVAIGSPENQLGDPTVWLAVSGYCSVRENGDPRSARYMAAYPGGNYPPLSCAGTANPEYDADGYVFAVDVPAHPGGPIVIEAFDASYDPASVADLEFRPPSSVDTSFTLYERGGTPFDLAGKTVVDARTVLAGDAAYFEQWKPVVTISDPQPGIYYLRIKSVSGYTDSFGSNGFGLRAVTGPGFSLCSRITDPDCVRISGTDQLPLYASLSNGSSTFYLGEIPPNHAGKKLKVSLFDVGEGADKIEILDPNGNPAYFTWETDCSVGNPLAGGCSGAGTFLDVSGSDNQIYADTLGASKFNDRFVELTIDLPADYATTYAGNWWQVRYSFGADITDRTTWSISIIGDPVRLVG